MFARPTRICAVDTTLKQELGKHGCVLVKKGGPRESRAARVADAQRPTAAHQRRYAEREVRFKGWQNLPVSYSCEEESIGAAFR